MAALRIAPYFFIALLSLFGFYVISTHLKTVYKIFINTAMGLISLYIFNSAGKYAGVTLGINLFSGAVVGLCGPFGIVILLLIRFFTF